MMRAKSYIWATFLPFFLCCVFSVAEAKNKHVHHQIETIEQKIPTVPPVIATYDLYLRGVHFLSTDIEFQEKDGAYHARVIGRTYGVWDHLFPWRTELLANGAIRGDKFVPHEYEIHDEWSHNPKKTIIRFDGKGVPTAEFNPPESDDKHFPVTNEQKKGSLDPVTGLLQMLASIAVENTCNIKVPVFEGRMRFDITGSDTGEEDIDEGDDGLYKGVARTCDANFTLVAGAWKNQTKSRFWTKSETERGREPFHLWLAKPNPDLPEIPVRIVTGSFWGDIYIHLSDWHTYEPE